MDILTLTANSRLALTIRRQYDQLQLQKNLRCWPSPNILPLNSWIEQTWKSLNTTERLLTPLQQQQLWQQITQHQSGALTLHTNSSAQQLIQAWQMLTLWQIPIEPFKDTNEETQLLFQCVQAVEQHCQQQQLISHAELPAALLKQTNTWRHKIPKKVQLTGFDDLPPCIEALIKFIAQHSDFELIETDIKPNSLERIECLNETHEIKAMASWAKQLWQQNPQQQITCVIPKLEQIRNPVDKIFHEYNIPYNISAGQKLTEFSLIEQALNILQLTLGQFNSAELAGILQSPYCSQHETDIDMGAMLDKEIRELNEVELPINALFIAFNKVQSHYPNSSWLSRWRAFCDTAQTLKPSGSSLYWAEQFTNLLIAIGWPGNRGLTSIEYQVLQRWRNLLKEFSELDIVIQNISQKKAIEMLQTLASQAVFQPEGSEAPIQILGLLESAGLQFDALWIMGLDSESWPPTANGNPFIPYSIQVKYALPHSSAEREYEYSKNTLTRLQKSAKQIVISSAQQQGDKTLSPSNMIAAIKLSQDPITTATTTYPCKEIETLVDDTAPKIKQDGALQGGSEIIKLQALCPFRAFGEIRLKARPMVEPSLNLESFEKGNIVHRALQDIWLQLKNQSRLKNISDEELDKLIDNTATHAIKTQQKNLHSESHHYFLETEKKRLKQLLKRWLELEKQRPDFQVLERENTHHLDINGLSIRCQVDRIDVCSDGRYIIDYKTGLNSPNSWFGERMTEPQLPLYCSFIDDIDGICFAEVRNSEVKFKGIVTESAEATFSDILPIDQGNHPDSMQDWQSQKKYWKTAIENLLLDFSNGCVEVDPLDNTLTCQYCQLQPLCRIHYND